MITPSSAAVTGAILAKGSVSSGTPQPDWSVTDDGKGLLSGTVRIFYNYITGRPVQVGGGGASDSSGFNREFSSFNKDYSDFSWNGDGYGSGSKGAATIQIPQSGSAHPYDSRLRCNGANTTFGQNNIAYCEASYIGLSRDPASVEWELTTPTEEESIDMHPVIAEAAKSTTSNAAKNKSGNPNIGQLTVKEGENGINKNFPNWNGDNVEWDEKTGNFKQFKNSDAIRKANLYGVSSWKVPRGTCRVSFCTQKTDNWFWATQNLGKIFSGPVLGPPILNFSKSGSNGGTSSSSGGDTMNWLLTSVSITEDAGVYKVQTEYMLSGRKGWNKYVYWVAENIPTFES